MTISQAVDPIVLTRTINGTPKQVYTAITDPQSLTWWLANASHGRGIAAENQKYLITWQDGNFATISIEKLEENEKVVWSWRANSASDFTTVTFTIEEGEGVTNLTLQHDGIDNGREEYLKEWERVLDKLVPLVETGEQVDITERIIIGIFPHPLTPEETKEITGIEAPASRVTSLVPNFGAAKAGVQVDDIIIGVAGERFSQDRSMVAITQEHKVGDVIEVELYRDGDIITLDMPLSGYPIPAIGSSFNHLANIIEPQYQQIVSDVRGFFAGVSEKQANTRPADGEWSAAETVAHLILSEPYYHNRLGGMIEGGEPRGWSGNNDARLGAVLKRFPNNDALLDALEASLTETIDILRLMPQSVEDEGKKHLWSMSFMLDGNVMHAHNHYAQITEALDAAK